MRPSVKKIYQDKLSAPGKSPIFIPSLKRALCVSKLIPVCNSNISFNSDCWLSLNSE